ncbi:MAG TPA: acetate--CoA ligase family protein, partial [Aestuariivirgaceae bacterium]
MRMSTTSPLVRLLYPRSIVFVGGAECEVAIRKTVGLGFMGQIFAIHPKRTEIAGIPCLRSIEELPVSPDAAFVAVKRERAVEAMASLRARGAGGAVIYASGFSETGEEGRCLQEQLRRAADSMPIIGPNCYGFVNYLGKTALWPDEHGGTARDNGVAIITQSGNIAVNFTMTRRGLPLAGVFSLGNQADVDIAKMLEALSEDERITAIGIHMEGLKSPVDFASAAAKARRKRKPIVALKTGRSEQGAKVAFSHTSSLAGTDSLYGALFERCGVARVHSVTAFVETLKFLHHGGPLGGGKVLSMSCSGGEAALIADMAEGRRINFPPFDAETGAKVAATLNDYVAVDNPLDYHTFIWNQEDKLAATFSAALSGGFDVGMLILDIPTAPSMDPKTWLVTANAFIRAKTATGARAAIAASLPECLPEPLAARLSQAGIAPMAGLEDALTAFEAAALIGQHWNRRDEQLPIGPADAKEGTAVLLSEHEAKQTLAAYGLAVPKGELCHADEAAVAAQRLGFPVAVKISSHAIPHKTEVDGVALHLRSSDDVAQAAERMKKIADHVLVERMAPDPVCELIIGVKADAQFGLVLLVGAGGTFTEFLQDKVTMLLPVRSGEIEEALDRLRISALLRGFRGKVGDRSAAVNAITAVARFAEANADTLEE